VKGYGRRLRLRLRLGLGLRLGLKRQVKQPHIKFLWPVYFLSLRILMNKSFDDMVKVPGRSETVEKKMAYWKSTRLRVRVVS